MLKWLALRKDSGPRWTGQDRIRERKSSSRLEIIFRQYADAVFIFPLSCYKISCSLSTTSLITHPSSHIPHHSIPVPHTHQNVQSTPALSPYLLSDTDNATSRTPARIARSLTLLVAALAQIVGAGVHDDGAAEHALGPDELDVLVGDGALGVALAVGFEVAEVADVALAVGGGAVGFGEGVDCGERGREGC